MVFRFRKSFKLGPVKLNFGKSGLGVSTGIRGARIGVNSKGTYTSIGIPGTGISSVSYVKQSSKHNHFEDRVVTDKKVSLSKVWIVFICLVGFVINFYFGLLLTLCIFLFNKYNRNNLRSTEDKPEIIENNSNNNQ